MKSGYGQSPYVSLTEEPKVAKVIGQAFARAGGDKDKRVGERISDPNQKLYLFKMKLDRLDVLYPHDPATGKTRFCNLGSLISGDTHTPYLVMQTEKKTSDPSQKPLTQQRAQDFRKGPNVQAKKTGTLMGEAYIKLDSNRLESFFLGRIKPEQITDVTVESDKARAFETVSTIYAGDNPFDV